MERKTGPANKSQLIKKLVSRVEVRRTNDQDLHLADSSVTYLGRDQNGRQGANRVQGAIELDRRVFLTFEYDVNLSMGRVVMFASIGADFRQMHGPRKLIAVCEGSASQSTGTHDGGQIGQLDPLGVGSHLLADS
ncbi:hypothetical protein Poly41_12070 [Novipirellula artificiosorum]|uniref:Uncharacterized protein n=1 Tax=Novipirellula artificiosorum TaxID=2528016 RepID=A0A5C6E5Z4_9BACT|nr:hypothetical protein Poly41_12070 [Novipirellula artificiosorum]